MDSYRLIDPIDPHILKLKQEIWCYNKYMQLEPKYQKELSLITMTANTYYYLLDYKTLNCLFENIYTYYQNDLNALLFLDFFMVKWLDKLTTDTCSLSQYPFLKKLKNSLDYDLTITEIICFYFAPKHLAIINKLFTARIHANINSVLICAYMWKDTETSIFHFEHFLGKKELYANFGKSDLDFDFR